MVLTGSERAFAAGADIKEMEGKDFIAAFQSDFIAPWQRGRGAAASRSSPRSPAMRWAAAASSR